MSSVHRFSWMILNAGRRFALPSRRRSSMEHINCLSPTAAGSSLPVERRGQVSHGAQFLLPWVVKCMWLISPQLPLMVCPSPNGGLLGGWFERCEGLWLLVLIVEGVSFRQHTLTQDAGNEDASMLSPVEEDVLAMLVTARRSSSVSPRAPCTASAGRLSCSWIVVR
jgi:hypothetical protein